MSCRACRPRAQARQHTIRVLRANVPGAPRSGRTRRKGVGRHRLDLRGSWRAQPEGCRARAPVARAIPAARDPLRGAARPLRPRRRNSRDAARGLRLDHPLPASDRVRSRGSFPAFGNGLRRQSAQPGIFARGRPEDRAQGPVRVCRRHRRAPPLHVFADPARPVDVAARLYRAPNALPTSVRCRSALEPGGLSGHLQDQASGPTPARRNPVAQGRATPRRCDSARVLALTAHCAGSFATRARWAAPYKTEARRKSLCRQRKRP